MNLQNLLKSKLLLAALLCVFLIGNAFAQTECVPIGWAFVEKDHIFTYVGAVTSLKGWAQSPYGRIIRYEWDFTGDGTVDYSSTESGETTCTFNITGEYTAIFDAFCEQDTEIPLMAVYITVAATEQEALDLQAAYEQELEQRRNAGKIINPGDGVQKKYAIIINGHEDTDFWPPSLDIYNLMLRHIDSPQDIYFLNHDGTNPDGQNPNGIIDYEATEANIKMVCDELAAKVDDDDILYFYFISHGGGYAGPDNGWGGMIGYDPDDEQDYPENNYKHSALVTSKQHHGMNEWINLDEDTRIKYVSQINDYIASAGTVVNDSDVLIEKLIDNYDYLYQEWGEIDSYEDNFNALVSPLNGGPNHIEYVLFDANHDGTLDMDINNKISTPPYTADSTDLDNAGFFDRLDINEDGDFSDWISIDEFSSIHQGHLVDDEIKQYLAPIGVKNMVIFWSSCMSGGYIEDLSSPDRVVMTASGEEQFGYTAWIETIPTTFDNYAADKDKNEYVDMTEVFNYVRQTVDIECYDDNGDGIPVQYEDAPANGDGDLGKNLSLPLNYYKPVLLAYDNFETGWGNYTGGGIDADIHNGIYAPQGDQAANIQDDNGEASSFYLTNPLDLQASEYHGIKELLIRYSVYAKGLDSSDEGFYIDFFDGSQWLPVDHKTLGDGLINDLSIANVLVIWEKDYNFSDNSKIRFRCDTSDDDDDLYFDEIYIYGRPRYPVPYTKDDSYTGMKNQFLDISDVIDNDYSPTPVPVTLGFPDEHGPMHGDMIYDDEESKWLYKPHKHFLGVDSFKYSLTFENSEPVLGNVTVKVEDYTSKPADGVEDKYALIINGEPEEVSYWEDVTNIYNMLEEYGLTHDDIYLFNGYGHGIGGVNPDGMVDGEADKFAIEGGVLYGLKGKIDEDDLLFVWIMGRGYGYNAQDFITFSPGLSAGHWDEHDYLESGFKNGVLDTIYNNSIKWHGMDQWAYYWDAAQDYRCRQKYVGLYDNVYIFLENKYVSNTDQEDITLFTDFMAGDVNQNGKIDPGEEEDFNRNGIPPYDPATGVFDEGDWGPIDKRGLASLISISGRKYELLDKGFDNRADIVNGRGEIVGTDQDNDGIADMLDVNDDGDWDDWVNIDEQFSILYDLISDDYLDSLIEPLRPKAMVIILGQSFSGGFVDDLSRPNRVIMTASEEEAKSYGSTFMRNIVTALSGKNYPGGTTVDPASAHVKADGVLDMVEVFNFASRNRPPDETPCYDDNGDEMYTATPVPANSDGDLGETIKLSRPYDPTTLLCFEGFENGFVKFLSGGHDAILYTGPNATEGNNAANLQDDENLFSSINLADLICLTPYNEVTIQYSVYAQSLDNDTEGFVVEYFDGVHWFEVDRKTLNNGLVNGSSFTYIITLNQKMYQLSKESDIRFRSISSGDNDDVYIDAIYVYGTINPPTDYPIAAADTYYGIVNESMAVYPPGIRENDIDPNNDGLVPVRHAGYGPYHGTLFMDNANGGFIYIPDQGFMGVDSFEYFPTTDTANYLGIGTVRIVVAPDEFGAEQELVLYDDFEDGFGNYESGGYDAFLYTGGTYAKQGNNAINVQDNSGIASSFSLKNGIDLKTPEYTSLVIDFSYYVRELEDIPNEGFWVQYYDGTMWSDIFYSGNIQNNAFGRSWVVINSSEYTFSTASKIRFMCDASSDYDDIYFDEIYIYGRIDEVSGPKAVADTYVVKENSTLTISAPGILENDIDPNNGLEAHIYTGNSVQHGTLNLNQDGSFSYIPDPGFAGQDSFVYFPTSDTSDLDSTGTVHILVEELLYDETFEDLCHCFNYCTLVNAPSTPAGDVGNYVGRVTIPYTCGSIYGRVFWHETCICLNGQQQLTLSAKAGLGGPEQGDIRFRMSVRFNTCESVEGDFIELDSSAADNFVDYEATISVPPDASYIRWVKFEFWQYDVNYKPSQTGYVDSISID